MDLIIRYLLRICWSKLLDYFINSTIGETISKHHPAINKLMQHFPARVVTINIHYNYYYTNSESAVKDQSNGGGHIILENLIY